MCKNWPFRKLNAPGAFLRENILLGEGGNAGSLETAGNRASLSVAPESEPKFINFRQLIK